MALPIQRFKDWVFGQLVASADMLAMQTQIRSLIGALGFGITGQRAFLPTTNGVSVVSTGGMGISVGGADELVYLPDQGSVSIAKVAYSTGAQAFVVPAADPSAVRHDLVCLAFATPDVNGHNQYVLSGGVPTIETVYDVDETYTIQYVQGTPGGGDPAVPGGYTALARITVPGGATSINNTNITILLPTIAQIIASFIFNSSLGTGITAGAGISVTPTVVAGETVAVQIANTGVLSLESLTGTINFDSPDNSVSISTTGDVIHLKAAGANLGQTIIANGGSSGGCSVVLPPVGNWYVRALCYINAGGNFFHAALTQTEGTALANYGNINATDPGGGGTQNAMAVLVYAIKAAGGQTVSFSLTDVGGSFGPGYPPSGTTSYTEIFAIRIE